MTIEEKKQDIQNYCEIASDCWNLCPIARECEVTEGEFDSDYIVNAAWNKIKQEDAKQEIKQDIKQESNQDVDMVNQPSHYNNGSMETIDEMVLIFGHEVVAHFCLCNAWKYRARAIYKNGEEDMKKADYYLKKYQDLMTCIATRIDTPIKDKLYGCDLNENYTL